MHFSNRVNGANGVYEGIMAIRADGVFNVIHLPGVFAGICLPYKSTGVNRATGLNGLNISSSTYHTKGGSRSSTIRSMS